MQVRLVGKQNVYIEIAEQYKRFIRFGVLKLDEKLPSCRVLGLQLGINPNTVERAYSLLESEGYIKTLPKKGVYVSYSNNAFDELIADTQKQISHFKTAGLSKEQVIEITEKVYSNKLYQKENIKNDSKEGN